jgi:hypothetical protein
MFGLHHHQDAATAAGLHHHHHHHHQPRGPVTSLKEEPLSTTQLAAARSWMQPPVVDQSRSVTVSLSDARTLIWERGRGFTAVFSAGLKSFLHQTKLIFYSVAYGQELNIYLADNFSYETQM